VARPVWDPVVADAVAAVADGDKQFMIKENE
jgi:hypothetical protein